MYAIFGGSVLVLPDRIHIISKKLEAGSFSLVCPSKQDHFIVNIIYKYKYGSTYMILTYANST
jgi:hypothetical protein